MGKRIEILIDENGEIESVETLGFKGKGCVVESQWVKDILGKEIGRHLSPAYFITEKSTEKRTKHLNICG